MVKSTETKLCEIQVKGLGSVLLVKTEEGIEIDVRNEYETIQSFKVGIEDFEGSYGYKLAKYIKRLDPTAVVPEAFVESSHQANQSPLEAAETWFAQEIYDIRQLTPLKGKASGFYEEAQKLGRPFIKISEEDYQILMSDGVDYYKTPAGRVVTVGMNDGNYALMPLQKRYMKQILRQNI